MVQDKTLPAEGGRWKQWLSGVGEGQSGLGCGFRPSGRQVGEDGGKGRWMSKRGREERQEGKRNGCVEVLRRRRE